MRFMKYASNWPRAKGIQWMGTITQYRYASSHGALQTSNSPPEEPDSAKSQSEFPMYIEYHKWRSYLRTCEVAQLTAPVLGEWCQSWSELQLANTGARWLDVSKVMVENGGSATQYAIMLCIHMHFSKREEMIGTHTIASSIPWSKTPKPPVHLWTTTTDAMIGEPTPERQMKTVRPRGWGRLWCWSRRGCE